MKNNFLLIHKQNPIILYGCQRNEFIYGIILLGHIKFDFIQRKINSTKMATQYFEHKLELGNFSEQPHFQLMEWHPSLNILAIASISVGTNIFFYGEDVSLNNRFIDE